MTEWFLATADAEEVWVHVVSRGPIHVRGKVLDLDAEADDMQAGRLTWATAADSLTRWAASYSASLLRVHEDEGHDYGHTVLGESRVLTVAEQVERGIVAPKADGFFVRVRLTDPATVEQFRAGQLSFVSPHLHIGLAGDDGQLWPCAYHEISLTANPVQKARQIPVRSLAGVALSHAQSEDEMSKQQAAKLADPAAGPDEGAAPDMEARLTNLEAQIAALAEAVAKMAAPPVEEPMMTDPEEKMSATDTAIDALRAELAQAQAKIAAMEAEKARAAAVEALSSKEIEGSTDALLSLAVSSPEAFAVALSALPSKRARNTQRAPGLAVQVKPEPTDPTDRKALLSAALAYKAEHGCSMQTALIEVGATTITH